MKPETGVIGLVMLQIETTMVPQFAIQAVSILLHDS